MKTWSKILISLGISGWVLTTAWAAQTTRPEVAAAIQAIQQAPDPSAAVTAYANGFAIDRNEPKLYEAYVARMIDLGLPELAYHQAQTLTTLDATNGLAWGVVAHVDARRAQMPEALSAIILAGQFAPDNKFVQQTAGEIVAWYDVKADKAQLPASANEGIARIRDLLSKQAAFSSAYDTAKKAYQGQASAAESAAPPVAYPTSPTPPPAVVYYPDYYYDWGPGWVQPAPWWWWQPAGFFIGFDFFPCRTFFVFDDFLFFRHHHFFHHDRFFFDRRFHRDGFFVRDRAGRGAFFGTPARANSSVAGLARARFRSDPVVATANSGARTAIASRQGSLSSGMSPAVRSTQPAMLGQQARFPASAARTARTGNMGLSAQAPVASASPGAWSMSPSRQGSLSSAMSPLARRTIPAMAGQGRGFAASSPTVMHPAPIGRAPVFAAPQAQPRGAFVGGGFRGGAGFHGGSAAHGSGTHR